MGRRLRFVAAECLKNQRVIFFVQGLPSPRSGKCDRFAGGFSRAFFGFGAILLARWRLLLAARRFLISAKRLLSFAAPPKIIFPPLSCAFAAMIDFDAECPWPRALDALRVPAHSFSRHCSFSGQWPPLSKFEAWVEEGAAKSGASALFVEWMWINPQGASVFGAQFENAAGVARLIDAHANFRKLPLMEAAEMLGRIDGFLSSVESGAPAADAFDRFLASLRKRQTTAQ
jgi:hypothetical protein